MEAYSIKCRSDTGELKLLRIHKTGAYNYLNLMFVIYRISIFKCKCSLVK